MRAGGPEEWRAGALVDWLISWPVGQRGDTLEARRPRGSVDQKWRDSFPGGGWRPQVAGGGRENFAWGYAGTGVCCDANAEGRADHPWSAAVEQGCSTLPRCRLCRDAVPTLPGAAEPRGVGGWRLAVGSGRETADGSESRPYPQGGCDHSAGRWIGPAESERIGGS
jgi:hypothetical protein